MASTKKAASKAAKTLSDPKASKKAKSAAGATLAKRAEQVRTVQSAPKEGNFSRKKIRQAVKSVVSSRSSSTGAKRR